MQRSIASLSVALIASAVVTTLGVTGASSSGPNIRAPQATQTATRESPSPAATTSGAQLWVKRYNGPANKFDAAYSVAVSPSGDRIFVVGESMGATSREDYLTVAYNAETGAQLWVRRYNGPGNNTDIAGAVAVSPSGDRVFVTGESGGATSLQDYATIAYNAQTGAQLWVKRYNGPGNGIDSAASVRISPSGGAIFVTGASTGSQGYDFATVAYDAATGASLWAERYDGPGKDLDAGHALAVTSHTVFVTGQSTGATSREDYATIAYDAATGLKLWVKRYNGPGNSIDGANSIKASPRGDLVFVSGFSPGAASGNDYATIAYNAVTGAYRWVERYNGPANGDDTASSLALSPAGDRVFVTGQSTGPTTLSDYVTVAYDAATGARLWATRYNGPANNYDVASSVTVGPGGKRVFVTGFSVSATSEEDYVTVAYSATAGTQLWATRYNGPGKWTDRANSIIASPKGSAVFVTGYSADATLRYDYATVAYRA